MPSDSPIRPQLLKGALAVYTSTTPGASPKIIIFQYNPEQIKRTLASRAPKESGSAGGAKEDVLRVQGPPVETITLSIMLSAIDQMIDQPNGASPPARDGLYPILSMLEMLLYPSNAQVRQNDKLLQKGKLQLAPADLPVTLLVWGKSRVAPILLTSFSVTEQAFDVRLNPIQAQVDLGMKVLTYLDLKPDNLGYDAYLAYQQQKESLAADFQTQGDESSIRNLLPSKAPPTTR